MLAKPSQVVQQHSSNANPTISSNEMGSRPNTHYNGNPPGHWRRSDQMFKCKIPSNLSTEVQYWRQSHQTCCCLYLYVPPNDLSLSLNNSFCSSKHETLTCNMFTYHCFITPKCLPRTFSYTVIYKLLLSWLCRRLFIFVLPLYNMFLRKSLHFFIYFEAHSE